MSTLDDPAADDLVDSLIAKADKYMSEYKFLKGRLPFSDLEIELYRMVESLQSELELKVEAYNDLRISYETLDDTLIESITERKVMDT